MASFLDLDDLLRAIPNGLEDAADDVLGLGRAVGLDIPHLNLSKIPVVGRAFVDADTTGGKILTGIVNFAAGFVPALGLVSKVGKGTKLLGGAGKLAKFGRGAVAGALTDFAVYDGNEERLSNLLNQVPALRNPVSEWLASDEDDGEILGRVKNVIEGAGLGMGFEALGMGLRSLKAQRAARAAGTADPKVGEIASEAFGVAADKARLPDPVEQAPLRRPTVEEAPRKLGTPDAATMTEDEYVEASNIQALESVDAAINEATAGLPKGRTLGANVKRTLYDVTGIPEALEGEDPLVRIGMLRMGRNKDVDLASEKVVKKVAEAILLAKTEAKGQNLDAVLGASSGLTREGKSALVEGARDEAKAILGKVQTALEGMRPEELAIADYKAAKAQQPKLLGPGPKAPLTVRKPMKVKNLHVLGRSEEGQDQVLRKVIGLTDEKVARALEDFKQRTFYPGTNTPLNNPRTMTPAQRAFAGMAPDGLNLHLVTARDDVAQLYQSVGAIYGSSGGGLHKVVTNKEFFEEAAARNADMLGMDPGPEHLAAIARSMGSETLTHEAVGRSMMGHSAMLEKYADEYFIMLQEAASDPKKIEALTNDFALIAKYARDFASEQGRQLQARQNFAAFEKSFASASKMLAAGKSPEDVKRFLGQMRVAYQEGGAEHVAGMMRLAEMSTMRKGVAITVEAFINSILSGAKTLILQPSAGMFYSVFKPIESMLGSGVLMALGKDQSHPFMTSWRELRNTMKNTVDTLRVSKLTSIFGENIYDPTTSLRDDPFREFGAISPEVFGVDPKSMSGAGLTWLGKGVRFPTWLIGKFDQGVKGIAFRSVVAADLEGEALAKGLRGLELTKYIEDGVEKAVFEQQMTSVKSIRRLGREAAKAKGLKTDAEINKFLTNEWLPANGQKSLEELSPAAQRGINRAREVTFQTKLRPGTVSKSVGDLLNAHPLSKLFIPFYNTPVDIALQSAQHIDVPGLLTTVRALVIDKSLAGLTESKSRFVRDMASGNPKLQAEAAGRIAVGFGLATAAASMAAGGMMTGSGPRDPNTRKVLMDAGWQPYSFKTKNGYVQYLKAEPFAAILGISADVFDLAKYSRPDDNNAMAQLAWGIASGFANNVTDRSYLAGLRSLLEAVTDPERKLKPWVQQFAGSVVPNAIGQAVELSGDAVLKDVQGLMDKIASRTPGFSDTVAPQRNVLGEPYTKLTAKYSGEEGIDKWTNLLSPIAYREVSDDVVQQELALLQHGFSPPPDVISGVDLRAFKNSQGQDAYDRWQELQGDVRISGRNIRQDLRALFKRQDYQALSPAGTIETDSPRVQAVKSVIRRYRERAFQELLREYPALDASQNQAAARIRAIRSGRRLASLGS